MVHEHKPKIKDDHLHGNSNGHYRKYSHREKEKGRLKFVIYITGITMIVEVIGGVISGSLALISDAGHMFTHAFALSISLVAIVLASKPADIQKTFGYYRIEIIAALFNSISLLFITCWIFYESYQRIIHPLPIKVTEMLIVSTAGLIVNIVSAIILVGVSKEDLNVRSAFIHMIGDTASSVGIILGAVIILYTGWTLIDPILSVLIGVVILIWAWNLARESLHILLEAVPRKVNVEKVKEEILKFEGVMEIADLHVWTITSNMYSLMAHIRVEDGRISERKILIEDINKMLDHKFDIVHTSLQLES
ncbi:MAG: cation diffusion facilitator family transporter [Candidatus Marinimicrobia bacterium]|nr:cation diffusion facilitator family transporter [Candidatus Neomarinimicrobiota bacterium]